MGSPNVTAELLQRLFDYNPDTGLFVRKVKTSPNAMPGMIAGGKSNHGYIRININGKLYSAHRLAWLYMTGSWPSKQLDHIDGDRLNNRYSNLREATGSENNQNQRSARRNSKSGLLGATFRKDTKRWQATIKKDGRWCHLGYFETAEEAHMAYVKAKRKIHEFCAI